MIRFWLVLFLTGPLCTAEELYFTDFENFPVGDNNWVGTDGWLGTENSSETSFIDNTAFNGSLGNTAGLGLERPDARRVSILKPINHDHNATGDNIIEIETLISIKDSTNNFYDDFYLSIYKSTGGNPIASIRFDNQNPDDQNTRYGIWREDGVTQFDTTVNFIHEELYDLFIRINLTDNTWSADLDGIPLFGNETFTSAVSGSEINFGFIAYEWQVSSSSRFFHGNNFLLVEDLRITSLNDVPEAVTALFYNTPEGPTLTWEGKGNMNYQVEYSNDLSTWLDDLPGSMLSSGQSSGTISFTDTSGPSSDKRFYRIGTLTP